MNKKKIILKKRIVAFISVIATFFSLGVTSFAFKDKGERINVIPKPLSYTKGSGNFTLTKDSKIFVLGKTEEENLKLKELGEFLRGKLTKATGYELMVAKGEPTKGSIFLTTVGGDEKLLDEGYNLEVTKDSVKITALKVEGIARGVQTLRQLLPPDIEKNTIQSNVKFTAPVIKITDKPEYSYRGLMLDVARRFFTVDEVKRQIDLAALYKINKVHLHLSDDQGWRLEIKKYPELATIGGSTEVGGGKGGYYTQEEFKDIVKYAGERYVEIIPEFDMPGHINAALASLGFLNPDGKPKPLYTGIKVGFSSLMTDSEKTYEFIDNVFKEVSEISPSKYLHIGGDEADATKKEDYNKFVVRVSEIAEKYGKTAIGWDPIDTAPGITNKVILENWKDSNEAARQKDMKMIIAIAKKAYLDMKYNKDTPYGLDWAGLIPVETAYNWDITDFAPKELVLGIEAPLWTETIKGEKEADFMIYPRLIGYGEIGWTPKENRNYNDYKERLRSHGVRLENLGVNYYKSPDIWGQ